MALIDMRQLEGGAVLGLWNASESSQMLLAQLSLTDTSLERLRAIRHDLGQRHFLCVRLLIKAMLGYEAELEYDSFRQPHLSGHEQGLSVSHSAALVAVLMHPGQATGVDVQQLTGKLERIAPKFLSSDELSQLAQADEPLRALHIYWGAKEALYKLYGKRRVDFREHLAVSAINDTTLGTLKGAIEMPDAKSQHLLGYEWLNDYALVYVLKDY